MKVLIRKFLGGKYNYSSMRKTIGLNHEHEIIQVCYLISIMTDVF